MEQLLVVVLVLGFMAPVVFAAVAERGRGS